MQGIPATGTGLWRVKSDFVRQRRARIWRMTEAPAEAVECHWRRRLEGLGFHRESPAVPLQCAGGETFGPRSEFFIFPFVLRVLICRAILSGPSNPVGLDPDLIF